MSQRSKLGLAAAFLGLFVATAALAQPAKNLQVLPKDMDRREVKKIMKPWTKALGVQCRHCHDMDDMAADSKEKKIARKMYEMQQYINTKYMKKYEVEVTCKTCHQGAEQPKK